MSHSFRQQSLSSTTNQPRRQLQPISDGRSFDELLAVLNREKATLDGMIALTIAEREAIGLRQIERVSELALNKEALTRRLGILDERRNALSKSILADAISLQSAPDDTADRPSLSQLAAIAPGDARSALLSLQEELTQALTELGRLNEANRELLFGALGMLRSALSFLVPEGSEVGATYSPNQKRPQGDHPTASGSYRRLDRKL